MPDPTRPQPDAPHGLPVVPAHIFADAILKRLAAADMFPGMDWFQSQSGRIEMYRQTGETVDSAVQMMLVFARAEMNRDPLGKALAAASRKLGEPALERVPPLCPTCTDRLDHSGPCQSSARVCALNDCRTPTGGTRLCETHERHQREIRERQSVVLRDKDAR